MRPIIVQLYITKQSNLPLDVLEFVIVKFSPVLS